MPGDDKKKEMKKEADELKKLMKQAQKSFDRLKKLGQGDAMFMNMMKMQEMFMQKQSDAMDQVIKNIK